jgi:hypothetical protein
MSGGRLLGWIVPLACAVGLTGCGLGSCDTKQRARNTAVDLVRYNASSARDILRDSLRRQPNRPDDAVLTSAWRPWNCPNIREKFTPAWWQRLGGCGLMSRSWPKGWPEAVWIWRRSWFGCVCGWMRPLDHGPPST